MGIYECLKLYNSLLNKIFILNIEGGLRLELMFSKKNFKHLLGLQKLFDVSLLSETAKNVYNLVSDQKITDKHIRESIYFNKIEERLLYFYLIPELLKSKIIVEFNSSFCPFEKYNTKLKNTKYILYKKIPNTYFVAHLTLSEDKNFTHKTTYYPETFFIEHSNTYISGQTLLEVKSVEIIDLKHKTT